MTLQYSNNTISSIAHYKIQLQKLGDLQKKFCLGVD